MVRGNWSDASVFSSTFDNYTEALVDRLPYLNLPVFTEEIGDTWIYGTTPISQRLHLDCPGAHACTTKLGSKADTLPPGTACLSEARMPFAAHSWCDRSLLGPPPQARQCGCPVSCQACRVVGSPRCD